MKYFCVIAIAFLFAGCTKKSILQIDGNTPGADSGTFMISDANNNTICTAEIKAGHFKINRECNGSGYYLMIIKTSQWTHAFDTFIEAGKYTITTHQDKPDKYPDVQSTSKKETDLAAFYNTFDAVSAQLFKKVDDLIAQTKDPKNAALPPAAKAELEAKLKEARFQEARTALNAISAFADKYPDNEVATHVMSNMNYMEAPAAYYQVFQKFSTGDKNSQSGKILAGFLVEAIKKQHK